MTNEQVFFSITGIITAQTIILITIIFKVNDNTKEALNKRIDDLKDLLKSEIKRLEDKLIAIEKRLDTRIFK